MRNSLPEIKRRADRDLAYIYLDRKKIYLGKWGSPESFQKYGETVSAYLFPPSSSSSQKQESPKEEEQKTSVSALFSAFIRSYETRPRYSRSDLNRIKHTKSVILTVVGDVPVEVFGVREMKKIKDFLLLSGFKRNGKKQPYSRGYINKILGTIKTAFHYGANELICTESDYARVKCVDLVRAGRTQAKERKEYRLITDEEFSAVLPFLQPFYRDMISLLESTGMRPSELCSMRGDEIDRSKDVWVYTPSRHKTVTKGKKRYIAFTREEQTILEKYMNDGYLFDLSIAPRERCRTGTNPPNQHESISSEKLGKRLKIAVRRAIQAEKLAKPWTLYNLRHRAITRIRMKYGAEYAQHFAGHSSVLTQQYYDHSAESMVTKLAETR